MPELCRIKKEIWTENSRHIQTVTQEVYPETASVIPQPVCLGSCTGSEHKSNLSGCGARSQRLTSPLFSDSSQIEQACRKLIRYTKSK